MHLSTVVPAKPTKFIGLAAVTSASYRRSANGGRSSSFVTRRVKLGDLELSVGGPLTADSDRRSSLGTPESRYAYLP